MKKYVARILVFIMLLTVVPTADVQAASKKKVYKAYYNYLSKQCSQGYFKKFKEFQLVKIDSDSVPEMIGHYKDKSHGLDYYIIICYNGKKAVHHEFQEGVAAVGGYRGSLLYIPGKGKIKHEYFSAGSGSQYTEIYSLKKGKCKIISQGGAEYRQGKLCCRWQGKKVSKKNYKKNAEKVFKSSKGKTLYNMKYISKAKMMKKLK